MGTLDQSVRRLSPRTGDQPSAADDESIVGEECHIVSGKADGPRHDPALARELLDDTENLILLCRIHHKMVDDQSVAYSVEALQKLKADHEKWVASMLTERKEIPPVRLRRVKENIPSHLVRVTTGQDVMIIGIWLAGLDRAR